MEDQVRKHYEGAGRRGGAANTREVQLPASLTVRELAESLTISPIDIIKDLLKNGIITNINQQLDFETAAIVADNFGVTAVQGSAAARVTADGGGNGATDAAVKPKSQLFSVEADEPGKLQPRPRW